MFCENCGREHFQNFCPTCGKSAVTTKSQTKYCKFCGQLIDFDAIVCIKCGKQVGELKSTQAPPTPVYVNNYNSNVNSHYGVRPKNKWVALLLCLLFGYLGVHKFYEGRILLGLVYLFTVGLFGIGIFIDAIVLIFKPNPYFP